MHCSSIAIVIHIQFLKKLNFIVIEKMRIFESYRFRGNSTRQHTQHMHTHYYHLQQQHTSTTHAASAYTTPAPTPTAHLYNTILSSTETAPVNTSSTCDSFNRLVTHNNIQNYNTQIQEQHHFSQQCRLVLQHPRKHWHRISNTRTRSFESNHRTHSNST